jgi:TIR domain
MAAFISYSNVDCLYGQQTKVVLAKFGIDAFLAHEDLQVSEEWRERILQELRRCEIFIPLLSANFRASEWAPQETGFIMSRPEVAVMPLSIDGTTPFGFISVFQSRRIPNEGVTQEFLRDPLARKAPRQVLPRLISQLANSVSFRDAEANMAPLVPFFACMTASEAQSLAEATVRNDQIWSARLCREQYLPQFVRERGAVIDPGTLQALQYQVAHNSLYSRAG